MCIIKSVAISFCRRETVRRWIHWYEVVYEFASCSAWLDGNLHRSWGSAYCLARDNFVFRSTARPFYFLHLPVTSWRCHRTSTATYWYISNCFAWMEYVNSQYFTCYGKDSLPFKLITYCVYLIDSALRVPKKPRLPSKIPDLPRFPLLAGTL